MESWAMCEVGGAPGQLIKDSQAMTLPKVYCIMALVLKILRNVKLFWNPHGDRGVTKTECHEMLNILQSESHDLGSFLYTEFH